MCPGDGRDVLCDVLRRSGQRRSPKPLGLSPGSREGDDAYHRSSALPVRDDRDRRGGGGRAIPGEDPPPRSLDQCRVLRGRTASRQWFVGEDFERDVLPALGAAGELYAYRHHGFWKSMDTYKDALDLTVLCADSVPPWTVAAEVPADR